MSVTVNVVGQTAVSISVASQSAASVSVAASTGASVVASGGIGPAGFITVPGTAALAFGTFQLTPGNGITVSTADGQFLISSYPSTTVSSLAPVQSVAGRTGAIVLQTSDVTAGTFAIGRIPTISYTSLSNTPATFSPSAHTHSTTDIVGLAAASFAQVNHTHAASDITSGVLDIGRIPVIAYTALSGAPSSLAPSAHTHSTADVVLFTSAAAAAAPVQSVAGRTGAVSLATVDVAGLAAVASSGSYTSLQNVPATFAPSAHTHGTADITGISSSFAAASHAHPYVTALNNLTGNLTLAAGTGVTLTTSSSTITIASTGGGGSLDENAAVDGGDYVGTLVYDRTITITQQPADQSAVSGAATISVTATASPAGTLNYQWQRYQSAAWANVTGGTSASLALTGLTNANNGDRYRCVISAQSAASVTSGEAVIGVNATAPGVPTNLSAVRGDNSITLSWTAPASNGGSSITDYVVQVYNIAGNPAVWSTVSDGTSTATSATITGVAAELYNLRVAAINAIGQGAYAQLSENVRFGPALLAVTENAFNATLAGLGDSTTPLVITRTTTSQTGNVRIKTANTNAEKSVDWYITVTAGEVIVYAGGDAGVRVSSGYSGSTIVSPASEIAILPTTLPVAFTFTAQRAS